jgi:hypothetical protein
MLWILIPCLLLLSQERFESGRLRGFTRSPTEHIIVDFEEIPMVRTFEGAVVIKERSEPLEGVLVELRGPGSIEAIRGVRTNRRGVFKFAGVSDGLYVFKVTLNGFQSIVGSVHIRRSGKKADSIRFEMLYGV